jgi:site-specific recombinase XerD
MEIFLSQAIEKFLLDKEIEGASPYTIRNYRLSLRRFSAYLEDDPPLLSIETDQARNYIRHFQTTQLVPDGIAPRFIEVPSPKTVLNEYTALASFWSWAVAEGYTEYHIIQPIKPPRPSEPNIDPLTQADFQALLKATDFTTSWKTKPRTRSNRPEILRVRDRALLLFLLDTGVRAAELCRLRVTDLDLKNGSATITGKSRLNSGQGKVRVVHFGRSTRKALWEYLTIREANPEAPVFATTGGSFLDRRHLGRHIKRLAERAGIKGVSPHRFRHTFAINYLRNGGDIYTLQSILGHTSLDMVRRYLRIAEADCADAHRRASPVDNWFK